MDEKEVVIFQDLGGFGPFCWLVTVMSLPFPDVDVGAVTILVC